MQQNSFEKSQCLYITFHCIFAIKEQTTSIALRNSIMLPLKLDINSRPFNQLGNWHNQSLLTHNGHCSIPFWERNRDAKVIRIRVKLILLF